MKNEDKKEKIMEELFLSWLESQKDESLKERVIKKLDNQIRMSNIDEEAYIQTLYLDFLEECGGIIEEQVENQQ